jgi:hypothetical protein
MQDKIFVDGMIFKKPRENAPEFVKGNISIKSDVFIEFLRKHTKGDGWVNVDLLKSREGKLYLSLNTFEPNKDREEPPYSDYEKSDDYRTDARFEQEREQVNRNLDANSLDF